MVEEADKKSWEKLAKEKYPKPLIFHDGRLAFTPTLASSLATLMWVPCGLILAIIRIITGLSLPYKISVPLSVISGLRMTVAMPNNNHKPKPKPKPKGELFACNHRTLLDPLFISCLLRRDLVAVTYSVSRMSEILSPIKTVRLTRNRDEDAKMMKRLLEKGDLVVCPEGTTCRERYLLRFSPLFAEMCDEITPVAIESHVGMFHGTTAGGFKSFDSLFFFMNPFPVYEVRFLEKVSTATNCNNNNNSNEGARLFEVANRIQTKIGMALGFECTKLTRKDKYLVLAGNDGTV